MKLENYNPYLKICGHPEFTRYLNGELVNPINIEISLTGYCNANCPWCFYNDSKDNEILNTQKLRDFICKCYVNGVKAITYSGGGEPTLHPDFPEILNFTSEFFEVGLFTNALSPIIYNPEKLKWLRISKTEQPFNVENFKLARFCKNVGLCINYTGNKKEILETLDLVHKYDLDYLQVRPALNHDGKLTVIDVPNIQDPKLFIADYKFEESSKTRTYTKCKAFWFQPFVWHNGDYSYCAYHKDDPKFVIGNIYKDTLDQIIERLPRYIDVVPNCQTCCKPHELNKLINDVENIKDINFV